MILLGYTNNQGILLGDGEPWALPFRGLVFQLVCRFHRYWAYSSKSTVQPKRESCFQDRACSVSSIKISGLSKVYTGLHNMGKHYAIHLGPKQNKKQRKEEFFLSIFLLTCSSWIIRLLILHWNLYHKLPWYFSLKTQTGITPPAFFLCPQLADRWKITALLSLHNQARQFLYIGKYIYAWMLYIYIYMHLFSIGSVSQENTNTSCKMKMKCGKMKSKAGEDLDVSMSNSTNPQIPLSILWPVLIWAQQIFPSCICGLSETQSCPQPSTNRDVWVKWSKKNLTWALWINIWVSEWKLFSRVRLFVTPRTTQSTEFSRPEYWRG